MKKIVLLLMLMCANFGISHAQLHGEEINNLINRMNTGKDLNSIKDLEEVYDGSLFLWKDWKPGVVTRKSGEKDHILMNYLTADNSLVYMKNDDLMALNPGGSQINSVDIEGKTFKYITYMRERSETVGAVEVLYNGTTISLFKKYDMELKNGHDGSGYKSEARPSIITKPMLYYQSLGSNISYLVPASKKEFYSIFKDKASQMENYAKKNRLKINEAGITKMVEYYNTL